MRDDLLKKAYISPEFDYVRILFDTVICTSAETPIIDIVEDGDDDDL